MRTTLRYHQRVQPPNARLWLPSQTPTTTATTATTTTTTATLRTPIALMLSKGGPPTNSWLNASLNFVKLVCCLARSEARNFSPCTQCTESGALFGSPTHYASGFPTLSLATFERHAGSPHPYSAVRDIRWISLWTRPLSSPLKPGFLVRSSNKDKLAASSFAAKTVTTIQRSPDVKARNFFRSLLASIGGKTLEAATAEATKIRVQHPIDRRTTKHGARFRITVPKTATKHHQRLERQSKQTHWRIRQNYRHRRPDQPRPTAPPPPLSRQILAVNVANISNKRLLFAISSGTPGSGPSQRPALPSSKFRFTVPGFDVISIQPLDLDAEESPSVFHRALVAMNMVVQLAQ
ncbi:hypothetical protein BASA81_011924 [Batrachochytrium salamandrivorans]|nr:hypothetical protein BASA81_011924 [Batrachochytrium salamandrivorans]